jgi:putative ABC transport system permease protein
MGNIQLLILTIGGVVFFTLLLVTGNTMAMSVRERRGELGVMKALGFSDFSVLGLVLSESVVHAFLGGGIGLAAVKLFSLQGDPTGGFLPLFYLAPDEMALGLGLTVVVGLMAGLIPALTAMRLTVVDAMRRA